MSSPATNQLVCEDCGASILGSPIRISRTEYLCRACWPFLLKPLVEGDERIDNGPPIEGTGTYGPAPRI
jgi:hypothetical protein